jgi:DNA-binding response OmpR family regulator
MCAKCQRGVPLVLFADDSPEIMEMLTFNARREGWEYETASTAEEMLQKISARCSNAHECFDLVVGDLFYDLPGAKLDGLTALREIRKKFRNLPFIFYSGLMEAMTKDEARKLGAFIEEKPTSVLDLFERIKEILALTSRYEGPERRRRSFNQTDFNRRHDDESFHEEICLTVPPAMAAVHRARAAENKK